MISDFPSMKESHMQSALQQHAGVALDLLHNVYQMRQLSIASIISVPEDHVLYEVSILNLGQENVRQAYLIADPNYWNIVGYPKQGELVLVMHQRGGNDAHILIKLQDKMKVIIDEPTLANADGITMGALQA